MTVIDTSSASFTSSWVGDDVNCCFRCLHWLRHSPTIIIVIVFFSLFTDSLLLTLVDPILPDILANLDGTPLEDLQGNDTALIEGSVNDVLNTNGRYGYMVAAKGAAQFFFNPFVGILVTKFGYRRPMIIGDIVLLLSTAAFAFGRNYTELLLTRILQGISSSVTAVTGMGLLAAVYTDDKERGKVMGIAIGGLSLGIIVGPVYGSVLYQFVGKQVPFLALAAMILPVIVLQSLTIKNDSKAVKEHSMGSICKLAVDPYIMIVACNIFLLNLDVSIILAFLPLQLIQLSDPETWQLGIVVLPTSIGYLLASLVFPRITVMPRWICAMMGLILSSGTLVALSFSRTFTHMLIVTTFLGISLGMVSTSMQPIFATLVDLRHSSVYGNVYAISDMSVCLAMFLGPLVGGLVVYNFGFEWLLYGAAIMNVCFSLFSILLRNPKPKPKQLEYETLVKADLGPSDAKDNTPLIFSNKRTPSYVSVKSAETPVSHPAMDLSGVPTPRYIHCMSDLEALYVSDGEHSTTRSTAHSTAW